MITSSEERSMTRREFLSRSAKAGACVAAAGGLSLSLYDSKAPQRSQEKGALVTLPDFSMPARNGQMSIVTGEDRVKTVQRALKTLGGIEAFVRPGDRVLVKVNAQPSRRADILQIVDLYRGRTVDVGRNEMILELTGAEDKIESFIEMLKPFGIKELARTGRIAMARGPRPAGEKSRKG